MAEDGPIGMPASANALSRFGCIFSRARCRISSVVHFKMSCTADRERVSDLKDYSATSGVPMLKALVSTYYLFVNHLS